MHWFRGPHSSIEWRLPLLAIGLLTVVAGTLTIVSYREVLQLTREAADQRLDRSTAQLAGMFATQLAERLGRVSSTAGRPLVRRYLAGADRAPAGVRATLTALAAEPGTSPTVAALWGADRRLRMAVPDSLARAWPLSPPPAGPEARIGPLISGPDTSLFYSIVAPVLGGDTILGYVVEHRIVASNPRSVEATRALIGAQSVLLLGGGSGGVWTDLLRAVPAPPLTAADTAASRIFTVDGRTYLGRARAVAGTSWLVVVGFPRDVLFAPVRNFLRRLGLSALVLLLVVGTGAWALSRRLTRPIRQIADASDAVAAGRYDRRVEVRRRDEIGRLADAFNDMARRVEDHIHALELSEARFRSLITATAQIVWTTDAEGRARPPQPSWQAYTGQSTEELAAGGWTRAVHPEDLARFLPLWEQSVRAADVFETEYRIRRHDGVYRWHHVRGVPVRNDDGTVREWIGTCTDITARRDAQELLHRKEEELRQAQKMEAIGRLAGGVAHDFNNLLTTILGPADLAMQILPAGHPARADIEEIRASAIRATEITRQLLAFSRQQVVAPEPLDLNDLVDGATRFLQRVIGEPIDLEKALAPDLGTVRADRTQIEQVIMNLAVNARDAMPEGGKLTIETHNVELDAAYVEAHPAVPPGPYVMLAVTDTGDGMSRETRARLFEPFFTTKERGKGTGLGLATVYGIVQQSDGHILVYSEPGEGTTFKILFPRVDEEAVRPRDAVRRDLGAWRGTETVLVAEDEEPVRRITARILGGLGYEVIAVPDGEAALAEATRRNGGLDLVVADVVMPAMSGGELARRLREAGVDVPVLFLSGYAGDAIVRHGVLDRDTPFLQKPFTPEALARTVREVLDARRRSA